MDKELRKERVKKVGWGALRGIGGAVLALVAFSLSWGAIWGLGWLASQISFLNISVSDPADYLLIGFFALISSPIWLGCVIGPAIWIVYLIVVGFINLYRYIFREKPKLIKPVSYFGGDGPCYPGGTPF